MSGKTREHEGLPQGMEAHGEWVITEFTSEDAGLTLRGRFKISPFQRLNAEQTHFLTTFLRCRGVISSVEKELGISYPTVRGRLDSLLQALELAPAADAPNNGRREVSQRHKDIIERLEAGELSPEEAKKAMKESGS